MIRFEYTSIAGCYELRPERFEDARGDFVKHYNVDEFKAKGLETEFAEEYYSRSKKNVIRGLHFQTPPSDHVKLVFCVEGEILDVLVDLRKNSPSYGVPYTFRLSAELSNGLYIPKGVAHGFCVLSNSATLLYKVTTKYDIKNDTGILWSSIDVKWPTNDPIVSSRDQGFTQFDNYESPFKYDH